MLEPLHVPNVTDVVYDVLRQRILVGNFVPGEQLNLRRLEIQMDVSRTPLKSALARLQAEGLVEIHPRRGTYVTKFSQRDIKESFEIRIALEAQALRYAFIAQNQTRVTQILNLLETMNGYFVNEETWLDELYEFMDLDRRMHMQIIELSNNQRMKELYEQANVQGYITIMGSQFQYQDAHATMAEHQIIEQALKSGSLEQVLEATQIHLERACDRAVQRLSQRESNE